MWKNWLLCRSTTTVGRNFGALWVYCVAFLQRALWRALTEVCLVSYSVVKRAVRIARGRASRYDIWNLFNPPRGANCCCGFGGVVGNSKSLFGRNGSVPFAHTNDRSPSVPLPFRKLGTERPFGNHEMHQPFRSQMAIAQRLPFCSQTPITNNCHWIMWEKNS